MYKPAIDIIDIQNSQLTPGEAIRLLREQKGLTQVALSRLSDISQSNIYALEKGRIACGRERALKLARALKVHPAMILFPNYD